MKYEDLNLEHISKDKEVLDLIKQKLTIEQKINELDEFALVLLELQKLELINNKNK